MKDSEWVYFNHLGLETQTIWINLKKKGQAKDSVKLKILSREAKFIFI